MAAKPKAGGAPKKTGDPAKQKEQSARFIEAAREAGMDESGGDFSSALDEIIKNGGTSRG